MSLESAMAELAAAINRNDEGSAVKEIIRQRDEALETARRDKVNWEWADKKRNEYYRRLETEWRRVRALKAYIKRLKKGKP